MILFYKQMLVSTRTLPMNDYITTNRYRDARPYRRAAKLPGVHEDRRKRLLTRREIAVEPQPGRLVMFESWLPHYVQCNKSDRVRISIAMNLREARAAGRGTAGRRRRRRRRPPASRKRATAAASAARS